LGALQLYIYDREVLKNYDLINSSLGMVTIKDSKIKDILNKIKNKEDISKIEESYLLDRMITGDGFLRDKKIKILFFTSFMDKLKKEEITYELREKKGGN
jgi:hypothetical protein